MFKTGPIQGWQCPICEYIYAPTMLECSNCNRPHHEKYKISTGTSDCDEIVEIKTTMPITTTDGKDNDS